MNCRHCNTELETIFCDLQTCPPSNAMVKFEELNEPETYLPLKVFVCSNCWLVQTDEIKKADQIFNDEYTYFSSFSLSWLEHSKKYVNYMIERFGFNENSKVIEIASNDGYLLQYFKEKNIPVLGVEPTSNTAKVAIDMGIETITEFFASDLAIEKKRTDAFQNVLSEIDNNFVKLAEYHDEIDRIDKELRQVSKLYNTDMEIIIHKDSLSSINQKFLEHLTKLRRLLKT